MSVRKNLGIDQGTTYNINLTVKDDADVPVDLTGYTATLFINEPGNKHAFFMKGVEAGSEGQVVITLTALETEDLEAGMPVYRIDLYAPDGTIKRLIYGSLVVRSGYGE